MDRVAATCTAIALPPLFPLSAAINVCVCMAASAHVPRGSGSVAASHVAERGGESVPCRDDPPAALSLNTCPLLAGTDYRHTPTRVLP